MSPKPATYDPGTALYDPATDRVGEYRGQAGARAMLRPLGGGREWEAEPGSLRPATDRERLSASVRAANDRTLATPPGPGDVSRPPEPVEGCPTCLWLADRRVAARASFDHSAVTDANVLMREHQRKEHDG
ncbi:hypothetical protein [Streptomyces sp. NPDC003717]|uniref:hypothetical protein n=1 Tax=Streptomyces sp. NPDC003717 TaxID=3154276 RepID=UPI0033A4EF4B